MTVSVGKLGVTMFHFMPVTMFHFMPECRSALDGLIHELLEEDALFADGIPRSVSPYELASLLYNDWLRPALDGGAEEVDQLERCARVIAIMVDLKVMADHSFDHNALVLRVISSLSQSIDVPRIALVDFALSNALVGRFEQHLLA